MSATLGRRAVLGAAGSLALGAAVAGPATASPGRGGRRRRIDVHCHQVPDFYRDDVAAHDGEQLPERSPEGAVDFMDSFEIEAQVVSVSTPACTYLPTLDERVAMARRLNDWTAHTLLHTDDPRLAGRFGAFAVLPLGLDVTDADVEAACAEAARAVGELGLDGVGLLSSYGATYLGDAVLDPLVATLQELDAFTMVHPATPAVVPAVGGAEAPLPPLLLEFCFDTTRAAVNMSYRGTYLKFPRLRLQLSHAGGTLPHLAWRATLGSYAKPLPEGSFDYGRVFYDTALSWGPEAMAATREVAAADHVLFGSDYPFTAAIWAADGDLGADLGQSFDGRDLERVLRTNALDQLPTLTRRLTRAAG